MRYAKVALVALVALATAYGAQPQDRRPPHHPGLRPEDA